MSKGMELLQAFRKADTYDGKEAARKTLEQYGLEADTIIDPQGEDDEEKEFQFMVRIGEHELTFWHNANYRERPELGSNVEIMSIERKKYDSPGYILPHEQTGLNLLVDFYRRKAKKLLADASPEKVEVTAWVVFIQEKRDSLEWEGT